MEDDCHAAAVGIPAGQGKVMFDAKTKRYLHDAQWAQGYRGREGEVTYLLAPGIAASIYDSDPMSLAVYHVNGEPVAGESCIVDHEAWAMRTREDADFLNFLRLLSVPNRR